MARLSIHAFDRFQGVVREKGLLLPAVLPHVALIACDGQIILGARAALAVRRDMIEDAGKMVQERCRIAAVAGIVIGDRQFELPLSDELAQILHGEREDRWPVTPPTQPPVAVEHTHLYRDWDLRSNLSQGRSSCLPNY